MIKDVFAARALLRRADEARCNPSLDHRHQRQNEELARLKIARECFEEKLGGARSPGAPRTPPAR
jgi:hypothetical protein